ncbi:uncharacterized protein LOC112341120 isoform X1 [Selaginella moellendorffii]|uniref:uncharacterized protein LOC112341120 isoform X1 n=1 Tax=Selaginella moellendorffii TaxID=88036 RepID=UPI000D1C9B9E|nr:uncharacterized protein LOC112341120 isoform X1 [Selaginella moellendorffii]|eukprot:XP_024516433.1 uncharacterized protein LOC112341120 isoform X1 [Selaginella moellendorffii]
MRRSVAAARGMHSHKEALLRRWQSLTGDCEPPPAMLVKLVEETATKIESLGPPLKVELEEDKRHRAVYRSIADSEQKLQFFSARQIACRLLSADGYLCDGCWLPRLEDCICNKIVKGSLWRGIKLWLYMHPKDFLRKNNTGKLLWQTFGFEAVKLCIFGVEQQENAMWSALQQAGHENVWCVYPGRDETGYRVDEIPIADVFVEEASKRSEEEAACALHFILMDGTWTNSKAMLSRINIRANRAWNDAVPCVTLEPLLPSAMHALRPQPSTEKTCTAAAASQLLRELSSRREMALVGAQLEESARVIDKSITCLFDSLACRRKRGGKPLCRLPAQLQQL